MLKQQQNIVNRNINLIHQRKSSKDKINKLKQRHMQHREKKQNIQFKRQNPFYEIERVLKQKIGKGQSKQQVLNNLISQLNMMKSITDKLKEQNIDQGYEYENKKTLIMELQNLKTIRNNIDTPKLNQLESQISIKEEVQLNKLQSIENGQQNKSIINQDKTEQNEECCNNKCNKRKCDQINNILVKGLKRIQQLEQKQQKLQKELKQYKQSRQSQQIQNKRLRQQIARLDGIKCQQIKKLRRQIQRIRRQQEKLYKCDKLLYQLGRTPVDNHTHKFISYQYCRTWRNQQIIDIQTNKQNKKLDILIVKDTKVQQRLKVSQIIKKEIIPKKQIKKNKQKVLNQSIETPNNYKLTNLVYL